MQKRTLIRNTTPANVIEKNFSRKERIMKRVKTDKSVVKSDGATHVVANALKLNASCTKDENVYALITIKRPTSTYWSLIFGASRSRGITFECALDEKQVEALREALTKKHAITPSDVINGWTSKRKELYDIKAASP